jgi:ribosomal protein S12 methylthiotransferase
MNTSSKYHILNLGCPKNEVDGQSLEYEFIKRGWITGGPDKADVIIVNTCGFIETAKQESIDEILRLSRIKNGNASLAVIGCLSQRYRRELEAELPEADFVLGLSSPATIVKILTSGENKGVESTFEIGACYEIPDGRIVDTSKPYAYLKIADGCDNRCSYCAIPLIRGPYRSRPPDNILSEFDYLLDQGIKEIILVAQDTTRYGRDLYGDFSLELLLDEITCDDRLKCLRILYAHPARVSISLLEKIADNDKICNYLDLPLQHASDNMLKRMNRGISSKQVKSLVSDIRNNFPEIALRTTFLLGHPGEKENDFDELIHLVEQSRFENLGCFVYSEEEGTPSSSQRRKVNHRIADDRYDRLMLLQSEIVEEKNSSLIGLTDTVMVDEYDKDGDIYYCRSQSQAPEIDGQVLLDTDSKSLRVGDFIDIRITGYDMYDLNAIIESEKDILKVS